MIRTLITTAAVGTALVAGGGLAAAQEGPVYHAPIKTLELPLRDYRVLTPLPLRCEEDEPCWDCRVLGNRICGPDVLQSRQWGPGGHTGSASPLRPAP